MNMKKEIVLEIVKGENTYRFSMPETAPLGEIYDVGFQILKASVQLAQNAVSQNEAAVLAQQSVSRVAQESAPVNCDSISTCEAEGSI